MQISEVGFQALRGFVKGYLASRCQVSSQHKLPDIEELKASLSFDMIHEWYGVSEQNLEEYLTLLVGEGKLFKYGPYISDHPIKVM